MNDWINRAVGLVLTIAGIALIVRRREYTDWVRRGTGDLLGLARGERGRRMGEVGTVMTGLAFVILGVLYLIGMFAR